jgi:hypothetical protein
MEYTFEDSLITVVVDKGTINFAIDPVNGLPEHAVMAEDFKDVANLERFVKLLATNPNTAFLTYLSTRNNP